MPGTAAKKVARAQLLLNFPPAADKMDEWRATIQSLLALQKKDTSVTFWAEQIFSVILMMIIMTKHGIIIDVVGSYFYEKNS